MTASARRAGIGYGLVLIAAAVSSAACSEATASDAEVPLPAAPTTAEFHLDAHALHYKQLLLDAGIPPLPDGTILAVANGICGQLSEGTDESTIIEHLLPVTQYASTTPAVKLTAEQVATLYIDVAEANYC